MVSHFVIIFIRHFVGVIKTLICVRYMGEVDVFFEPIIGNCLFMGLQYR